MSEQTSEDFSKRIGHVNAETGGLDYPELDGLGRPTPDDRRWLTTVFPTQDMSQFYVLPVGVGSTPDHDAIVKAMGGTPAPQATEPALPPQPQSKARPAPVKPPESQSSTITSEPPGESSNG